ncbi:MAG: TatD family hydrolase [bacterium]|nr:TatD family hydrolase [bacterium]
MEPRLIDTHAHVNFNAFKDDGDVVAQRAIAEGVWFINVGSQIDTSRRAVEYAERHSEGVFAIVGLHPIHLVPQEVDEEETHFTTRAEAFDYDAYKKLAQHPKVVGIGECGLEYYRLPGQDPDEVKRIQKETFIQQIELAVELKKPLMVHSRDAYADIHAIIKEWRAKLTGVIIHSFIGSWDEAKKFLDLDCHISFNGIITYKPRKEKLPGSADPGLHEAVKNTPLDHILLETDSPYLSPAPHRGERNNPSKIKFVAQKIAELKHAGDALIAEETTANARKLFTI